MMSKLKSILTLSRPANVVTALADILAGMALVGFQFGFKSYQIQPLALLGIASMLFYAGGIILNDVFDRKLDAIERPERILPSKKMAVWEASLLAILFFILGICLSYVVSAISAIIGICLVINIFSYDYLFKKYAFLGPLNMGVCRGLNLILGMSIYDSEILEFGHLALLSITYIFAVTLISRGENKGENRWALGISWALFLFVQLGQLHYSFKQNQMSIAAPFILAHALWLYGNLWKAMKNPQPNLIKKTVKTGVITLIIFNASWVACSGNIFMACITAALLPISLYLAKYFAVT